MPRSTASTGNVFRDCGFPKAEAELLLKLAKIKSQVNKMAASGKPVTARAAKSFGLFVDALFPLTGK